MCERYRPGGMFLKLMDDGDGRCLMCLGCGWKKQDKSN